MIKSKGDLDFYIAEDAKANSRQSVKPKFFVDEIFALFLLIVR